MRFGDKDNPVAPSPVSWNPYYILKELFHHDGPSCSRIPRREKLAEVAWSFSKFALVWAEWASSTFICLKICFFFLGTMAQIVPHLTVCISQFAGIASLTIQLKHISLVNMYEDIEHLKQLFVFILSDFTNRTSTCLYSELHQNCSSKLIFVE